MMITTSLFFALLLRLTSSCSTENDNTLRQAFFDLPECMCREYQDTYATCYGASHCKKFPRTFQTHLGCFKLQTTDIMKLTATDFSNLTHLTGLFIEANKNLVRIQPGTFRDMKKLITLSLSYNMNLSRLDEHVFKGLVNLETLILTRNGFKDFKDFSFALNGRYMPKLKNVVLKDLNFPIVDGGDLINLNGSQVRNITFEGSQVKFIDKNALIPLTNLESLSISGTLLKESNFIDILEAFAEKGINLESVNLKGWGFNVKSFDKLFGVIANTTIKELILDKNIFHVVDDDTFPVMPNIESLVLHQCMITDVKKDGFLNFQKLRELHLKENRLINVPEGVLLPTIELLDISGNTKPGTSYLTLEGNVFRNMTSLKALDLSNNNLRKVFNGSFNGLTNLIKLNLYHSNILAVHDDAFVELIRLEYLDLGKNPFPQRTFQKSIFNGLKNLKYLSLENCNIDHFPVNDIFGDLTSLETLNLKYNYLNELPAEFILSMKPLKVLDLTANNLKMWKEPLFKNTNVENLTVSSNFLNYLTGAMLEDISHLKAIDVSRNPFYCECANLIEPFNSLTPTKISHVLNLLNNTMTFCLLPEVALETSIVSYYRNNYNICEHDKIAKLIEYLIPSLVCLVLLILLITLSIIYRWHIRYWIFLTKLAISKRTQFKKRQPKLRGHTNYLYDAFVSYSTEDRNFVIRLVGMLENYEPFLKLCVYERDFEIGTIISESVLECLSKSRKTLLVISNSYIKSQWCIWEAQVAENHRLFFENEHGECVDDSLIMIKLGNTLINNISPMLKYLMKTRIHLQWDSAVGKQKQFWEKLRNTLATTSNEAEERNC